MIWLLYFLMFCMIALGICQAMYVIVMALDRAHDEGKLAPASVVIGYAFMYFCLVWDVLCNVFIASLIFLELPREATISQRLRRLVKLPAGWRKTLAIWFATHLLNPFSNGGPHVDIPPQ